MPLTTENQIRAILDLPPDGDGNVNLVDVGVWLGLMDWVETSVVVGPSPIIRLGDVNSVWEPIKYAKNSYHLKKWEVYDARNSTILLSAASYSIRSASTGEEVKTGTAPVENYDLDENGRTIRSVSIEFDLTEEWAVVGSYRVSIYVELISGDSEFFEIPLKIVQRRD